MYVTRLHIDRFGILGEQDVEGLSPGVNLFLGRNEAGKSTCLRFFQSMLFGYRRGARSLDPMRGRSGRALAGGTLFLDSEALGAFSLTRRPGVRGGALSLAGNRGEALDEAALRQVFGSLTVDVYDAIFAFSLKGLMEFSSLKGDSVRHALHGAAFGTGLHSPARALKDLEGRMAALLKQDRASAAINNALRELTAVQDELRSRLPELQQYAALQSELDGLDERLNTLREQREARAADLRRVRSRRDVWQQWEALRRVREELAAQGFSSSGPEGGPAGGPPPFAPDAVQRLDALLMQEEERGLALREAEEALARLEADILSMGEPRPLAALHPAVQTLRDQKERRRAEAEGLPGLDLDLTRLAAAQERTLLRLGAGWTAERVARADCSLAASEGLHGRGKALEEAEEALNAASGDVERLAEECAEAARQEEQVKAALVRPQEEAQLPDAGAEAAVAAALAGAQAALGDMPRLREREGKARDEEERALAAVGPEWTRATLDAFDASPASRQGLNAVADACTAARESAAEAARALAAAEQAASAAAHKRESLEERVALHADLPDRAALETRHALLRQMQRLVLELAAARREYASANAAVSNRVVPLRARQAAVFGGLARNPLLLAGGQLALAGLALGVGGWFGGAPALYYAGCLLVLFGLPGLVLYRSAREPERRDAEISDEHELCRARTEAEERKNSLASALSAVAASAASWLEAAEAAEPGEGELALAERLLERQGQQLALRERDEQELAAARDDLESARRALTSAQEASDSAGKALAEARRNWQAALGGLSLPDEVRPEGAAGVFDRAAVAGARVLAADEAVAALREASARVERCLALSRGEPFFALALASAGEAPGTDPAPALDALGRALKSLVALREEEQERLRRVSVLEERSQNRQRLEQRLAQAEERNKRAADLVERARQEWAEGLAALGLDPGHSPGGAAEALGMLTAFAEREKELAAGMERRNTAQSALRGFIRDIAERAREAGLDIPAPLAGSFLAEPALAAPEGLTQGDGAASGAVLQRLVPVALHVLDSLCARVEAAAKSAALLDAKEEQRAAREGERAKALAALDATRRNLRGLLAGAGLDDAEAFRAAFAARQRLDGLLAEERSLMAGLRSLAAGEGSSPEDVLAQLDLSSFDALADEEAELARAIEALEEESAVLAEERGRANERRDALAGEEGAAALRRREAGLKEDLHRLSRQWGVQALARDILLTAKRRFEEEGQEGVIRHAGDIFSSITDGEYTGMAAGLDGEDYAALHRSGERRDPERELSQGAREQLYLALRLAYVKNHAAKAEPMPLVMDEILVNFDPVRAANAAALLAAFAGGNQIFYFTCHPDFADMMLEAARHAAAKGLAPPPAAFAVEKGVVAPIRQ